jgi:hypothetical protein
MKRIKLLVGFLVVALLLTVVSAAMANGPKLDGVWFKVKVQAKGYSVDPTTGEYSKLNLSFPVYMKFWWEPLNELYFYHVYQQTNASWQVTSAGPVIITLPGENFISHFELAFDLGGGDFLQTYHTPFINIKTDTLGKFVKATYKGTGEISGGKVAGGTRNFYGYFLISGTSVDASTLPFDPIL